MKKIIALTLLFTIVSIANTWESKGMGGGGTLINVSINPHNSYEIFVGTDMSEVFYNDLCQHWCQYLFRRTDAD